MKQIEVFHLSVFYERGEWDRLITKCIAPALSTANILSGDYFLHFSDDQGYNIRITFKGNRKQEMTLINRISAYLNLYPSQIPPVIFPLNSLFIDFPNNSLHKGIYKPYFDSTSILPYALLQKVRTEITKMMILKLCSESIAENTLFTLAVFLQMASMHCFFHRDGNSIFRIKEILKHLDIKESITNQVLAEQQAYTTFDENAIDLMEFSDELVSLSEDHWIADWCMIVNHIGKEIQHNKNELFIQISVLIFEHLGINKGYIMSVSTHILYLSLLRKRINNITGSLIS